MPPRPPDKEYVPLESAPWLEDPDEPDRMTDEEIARMVAGIARALPELVKKLWDEGKHPREPAGSPEGGRFTSGDGGEPGTPVGEEPLLISERPGQTKLDDWNRWINEEQEKLNQAGKSGEHEDEQFDQMSKALSAYSQEDQKTLDNQRAGINVRYDLDDKLKAAAYVDLKGKVAKVAYFGALSENAHKTMINDISERWAAKADSIEVNRWKHDPSLPLWEAAGFTEKPYEGDPSVLTIVTLEKKLRNVAPAPSFEDVPVPVNVSEGTGTDFQTEVHSAIHQIPSAAMKTMADEGIKFRVGQRMTELNPELKGVHPRGWSAGTTWDSAEGMYRGAEKAVNITEFYRPVGKKDFVRTNRARGVVLHEGGHAYDDALGKPSENSAAFIYAYTADRKGIPKAATKGLRYFLQKGKAGRSEAFAEIFGWHIERGSGRTDIRPFFPKTSELVKQAMIRGLWLEPTV